MARYLVHNLVMIRLNIHEAKTHLSRYLAQLEAGEVIVICKRNVPIAEIRPLPRARAEPRPIGLAAGRFEAPDAFFDPLSDALLEAFEGTDG